MGHWPILRGVGQLDGMLHLNKNNRELYIIIDDKAGDVTSSTGQIYARRGTSQEVIWCYHPFTASRLSHCVERQRDGDAAQTSPFYE